MVAGGLGLIDVNFVNRLVARFEPLLRSSRLPVAVSNLASGDRMAVHELADQIMRLSGGSHIRIEQYTERSGYINHQSADARNSNQYFGSNAISFEHGLENTYAWYRKQIDLWRLLFLRVRSDIISEMQPFEKLSCEKVVVG